MNVRVAAGVAALVIGAGVCFGGENVSVAVKGSYTTSTRFLYNVDRPDDFIDDKYFSPNFGLAVDLRWLARSDDFLIGINVEKIKTLDLHQERIVGNGVTYHIPVEEGFVVYPVELTGYFIIPVSSEDIRVYLGGGVGWYFGERLYSIANAHATTSNSPSGFGIHVLTGVDFRLYPRISIRGELKFRDPQFDSTNRFEESTTTYNGVSIVLDRTPSTTRVNLNGITYGLGLVFSLW